jgi:hypothetical protein
VAQLNYSTDGISYSAVPQTLFAHSQLGVVGVNFKTSSGLLISAAAGAYVLNTVYDFTVITVLNANNYARFSKCIATSCGAVYATAGLIAGYPFPTYNPVAAAGTVATTSGSQIVVGTGTAFLSMGARDGDGMVINGQRFMISVVLDDTHIALDAQFPPLFTLAGLDYAAATGAGFWEDIETGNQMGSLLDQCSSISSNGMRFGGLTGPVLVGPISHFPAIHAFTIGTNFED